MRTLIIILLFCFIQLFIHGQRLCSGILLDSLSGQPVEFANIGVVGKGAGTVSNERGEFSFTIPDSLRKEQVKISMIGYRAKYLQLTDQASHSKIYLSPSATTLGEIQIVANKTKVKLLGNDTRSKLISAGFNRNNLGAEIAIKLRIKHHNTQLRKFFIHVNVNALEAPAFRLNVYSVNKQGWPEENMLKQNIIIEPGKGKTGLVEVDLLPYNIVVSEDVFISLEWIKDLGTTSMGLTFSTKLVGSDTYFRHASQDKWERRAKIGVGLHAEVAY